MQKPTKEVSDSKIRGAKKEEVKFSEWQLFTCDGVSRTIFLLPIHQIFEPPMISSQTPIGSDKKAQFQSSVSFPGLTPPDQVSVLFANLNSVHRIERKLQLQKQ